MISNLKTIESKHNKASKQPIGKIKRNYIKIKLGVTWY